MANKKKIKKKNKVREIVRKEKPQPLLRKGSLPLEIQVPAAEIDETSRILAEAYLKELCDLAEIFPKLKYIKTALPPIEKLKELGEFAKYFRMAVNFLKDELDKKEKELLRLRLGSPDLIKETQILKLQEDFKSLKSRFESSMKEKGARAGEGLIIKLLSVVDNFERALSFMKNSREDAVLKGILMTYQQLGELLKNEGLEEIESIGKLFDPKYHEAVEKIKTNNYPDQTIIEEARKGYIYKGKIIRPALVKVTSNVRA